VYIKEVVGLRLNSEKMMIVKNLDEKIKKTLLVGAISLAVGLGAGYYLGRHYNEPVRVENLNANPDGPYLLLVENRKIMRDFYFIEQEDGSFKKE